MIRETPLGNVPNVPPKLVSQKRPFMTQRQFGKKGYLLGNPGPPPRKRRTKISALIYDICVIISLEVSRRKGGDKVANRQQILDQFAQNFGLVPDFLSEMPDPVLEQYNNTLNWVLSDTALSARDKALVAFGAATAIHCAY